MANIGKNISKLRKKQNMTQDELAEKLFLTRQTISGWEIGRTEPSLDMLGDLAEALSCSTLDIIGENKNKLSRELFVAYIYDNEALFYKISYDILKSDYLCEIAIKNSILKAFSRLDKFSTSTFANDFSEILIDECTKLKDKGGK